MAVVLRQQVAGGPVSIAEQVDHRLLAAIVAHQQGRSVFVHHEQLVGHVLPAVVHVERGIVHGGHALDIVVLEVLQSDGGSHLSACAHGCQLHVEAHLPLAGTFVGDVQDDVVEVEVHRQEVWHLVLIAVHEGLRLWRVCDELLGVERLREVHLALAGREGGHRVAPLVVYQCGIERFEDAGVAEAHVVGRLVAAGHHLCDHLGVLCLTGVGSQYLQPLGIHVGVGLHRDAPRVCQRPVVVLVERVYRRQAVADFLGNLLVEQVARGTRVVGDHHGDHYQ